MPSVPASNVVAGALFGASLAASGVYLPSIIVAQMQLDNFHMMKVFLTASASSAMILSSFDALKISEAKPRPPSPLGFFGHYDGNIIGGAMIGLGMTLTGACPGTVLVQAAMGISSGYSALAGGLVGGIMYARIASTFKAGQASMTNNTLTIQSKLNIPRTYAVAAYEALCLACLSLVTISTTARNPVPVNPFLGGSLIGMAQAATIILTDNPIGVSTAYENLGQLFWQFWLPKSGEEKVSSQPKSLRSILFATGIMFGAFLFTRSVPTAVVSETSGLSPIRSMVGGFVMVMGARLAGGCTSGHGISGMSLLSISSIITVVSMFGGGFASGFITGSR